MEGLCHFFGCKEELLDTHKLCVSENSSLTSKEWGQINNLIQWKLD